MEQPTNVTDRKDYILPKFLFLFQYIPLFLPNKFFQTIDEVISTFLWNKKAPRIRKSPLQKCEFNGGLALPNFQLYYWSAHIHKIIYWLRSSDTPWCRLEAQSCNSSSFEALLTTSLLLNPGFTDNPIVRSSLTMTRSDQNWHQAIKRTHTSSLCARHGLIQFKVLHRVNFSKAWLSEIFPEVEDRCDRCHTSPCNLSHMF